MTTNERIAEIKERLNPIKEATVYKNEEGKYFWKFDKKTNKPVFSKEVKGGWNKKSQANLLKYAQDNNLKLTKEVKEVPNLLDYTVEQSLKNELEMLERGFKSVEEMKAYDEKQVKEMFDEDVSLLEKSFLKQLATKPFFTLNETDSIIHYSPSAVIEAIAKYAEENLDAKEVYYSSISKNKYQSSVYLKAGNIEVRLSDHDIPAYGNRNDIDYKTRWNKDLVIDETAILDIAQITNEKDFTEYVKELFTDNNVLVYSDVLANKGLNSTGNG